MHRSGSELPSPSNIKSFVGGAAAPVQLTTAPGGELFYVDIANGTIRRIRYVTPPPNSEDKALNRPATASSTETAGLEPGRAVDGDLNSRWGSEYIDNQWWQVDLGSARQVDRVRINWETAYASRYRISTSTDGTTFSTAAEVSITQAGVETTSFTARGARYLRVTGLQRGTAWGISMWDVNVYGPADTTANNPPVATVTATPTTGEPPLAVSFDGTGSRDPDGDALSYAWDLDGDGAHDDATGSRASWTYGTAGTYTASLRVSDARGASDTKSVTISVGQPKATIATPSTSLRWAVGDTISFSGSAVDNRGQAIPASGLTWTVSLYHGECPASCHQHPVQRFSGVASGSFRAIDHEYPSELDLTLTATDANGVSGSTSIRLLPNTVDLTLASAPSGLQLVLNGSTAATPFTRTVIVGSTNTISAPSPQTQSGTWNFASWSDGGTQTHTITAPTGATTYTATFTGGGAAPGPEDKALNRPATASSTERAGLEPGKAVDGSSTTRWSSAARDREWWQVDLGRTRKVDQVRVNWEAAYARVYEISTSTDGKKFHGVTTVTIGQPGPQATTFAARDARYVRITGERRATSFGISFWDVNVFGPADALSGTSVGAALMGSP
jgi:PKD repeat protein